MKLIAERSQDTLRIAEALGTLLTEGSLLVLSGELGAGKTTFTQGLAKGLGVLRNVTSPTFTIMKNYQGRLSLNHIDAYRLENVIQDLGLDEYIDGDGVTVIEWADFIKDILPEENLDIEFQMNDDDSRTLIFSANGERYQEVLERLCMQLG